MNTTVLEGQSAMIHCVAIGEPKPMIFWDKNFYQNSFDPSRIQVCIQNSSHTNYFLFYIKDKHTEYVSFFLNHEIFLIGCFGMTNAHTVMVHLFMIIRAVNLYKESVC